ncbi:LysM peptidoglycan-binding domain-containing protein [Tumebacillus permanentifrigoris]|uniref:Spore germination protein YaaH n=1 Tax=Tumebacillus permanentifrigoris TaxID=378543 RepID=A0A316DZP8_9BACL|nr:LysM peptidoglycan-binding domain-containing protein [Tumebacillus permanentifrigoris]PWK16020.1 spore germination protein YaaH [Tumebacillus permanentifrigoris]
MYVHVVKRGENLQAIARAVGVEAGRIVEVNGLESEELVPGTSLLVPTQVPTILAAYTVKEADTLRKIANHFHIPEKILLAANLPLNKEALPKGRVLTVPVPVMHKRGIEINMRLEVQGEYDELATIDDASSSLSSMSLAAAIVSADGTLHMPPLFENRRDHLRQAERYDREARAEEADRQSGELGASTSSGVSNLPGASGSTGSCERRVRLLLLIAPEDEEAALRVISYGPSRQEFFQQLRPWIAQDEFAGIHLEFTHLPPSARLAFSRFVRELAMRVHQKRGKLYLSVPPHNTDDPQHPRSGAYDLGLMEASADRIIWNAEESGGRIDGPPMALAPLHIVRRSLEFALQTIPRHKLLLGVPFYGFDWPMPYKSDKVASLVLFGPELDPDSVTEVPKQIHWDDLAVTPMYTYRAEGGHLRQVWYEDARSIAAKLQLVQELGLAGVSAQVQGLTSSVYWELLRDTFEVL